MAVLADFSRKATEASEPAEASVVEARGAAPTRERPGPGSRRTVRVLFGAVAVAALAGVGGWQAPQVVARLTEPSYLGSEASVVAEDLGCTQYKQSPRNDKSVYEYHDQGTCVLDGTTVTVTTFDDVADSEAFLTLMNGLIPVLHPTWEGAASAAGEGWNVADTANLSPEVAEKAILRLGVGEVRVIPSAS